MAKAKNNAAPAAELPKVGDKIIGQNGVVGMITEIKQDTMNTASDRQRKSKPYAVIEWQNSKKGQAKTSRVQPGYLNYMEAKGGITIERAKSEQTKKSKAVKAPEVKLTAPTFTVMAGRNSKTFATKAEAKAYEKACRRKTGKKYEIKTSKKKPSHKVVSFTAKSK